MNEKAKTKAAGYITKLNNLAVIMVKPNGFEYFSTGIGAIHILVAGDHGKAYRAGHDERKGRLLLDTEKVRFMGNTGRAMAFLTASLRLRNHKTMEDILRLMGFIL